MTQNTHNSYLQRYQLKQNTHNSRSLGKVNAKSSPSPQPEVIEANQIGHTVGKLSQRVDGIQVKIASIVNVVKLLQKYTETRDDQYEKQKENGFNKKNQEGTCGLHCSQMELKVKEFDILTKQFKDQFKNIEKLKASFTFNVLQRQQSYQQQLLPYDIEGMQQRLRSEINKKMQICIKLINSNNQQRQYKSLGQKVNEISFNLNQLQNQCRRNKMMLEKELDNITLTIKENSTQVPNNYSRVTENEVQSRSPLKPMQKSKSRNSKSDKSISRGKQNRSAVMMQIPKDVSKIKQDQLKQALRKKKEHREKLKVKNW